MKKRDWQERQPSHSEFLMVSSDNHKTLVPLREHSLGAGGHKGMMACPQAQSLGLSCDSAPIFSTNSLRQLFSSSPANQLFDRTKKKWLF